jgi:hypothetical protein
MPSYKKYWNLIKGTDEADTIYAPKANNVIWSGGGDDTVYGNQRKDIIFAGDGNDTVDGGAGRDAVFGGAGNDTLMGGEGHDWLVGGNGVDTLSGGEGYDSFVFSGMRFNGGPVVENDHIRQVVNTPDIINDWDIYEDRIAIDASDFGVSKHLDLFSGSASDIPETGVNFVVLQDTDNDANAATPFNAGAAASLIAASLDTPGSGFFIYHNSALQINRVVYSSDLSDPNADISVVANLANVTGADALAQLAMFSDAHIDFIA